MTTKKLEEELKFFIENELIPQIRLIIEDDKTLNKEKVMKIAVKQFINSLPERYRESIPEFETVIKLIEKNIIDVSKYIDSKIPLEKVQDAYLELTSGITDKIKIVVKP